MPTLEFLGRGDVYAHHLGVEYRTFEVDKRKSLFPKAGAPNLNDNLIIHGDNLLALKALMLHYAGKVNCIYIDPPYNTGNEKWRYNDRVNSPLMKNWLGEVVKSDDLDRHEKWLCMMWPRLNLLKELLADDGVIFVSIDDNEVGHLRLIMDEIFGAEKFIAKFVWQTKTAPKGVPPTTSLICNHEYVLCYARGNSFSFHGKARDTTGFSNPDNDSRGLWKAENMKSTLSTAKEFTITDPTTGNKFTKKWGFSELSIKKMIKEAKIIFPKSASGTPRQKKFLSEYRNGHVPLTSYLSAYHTETATNKLKEIFGGQKSIDFPKPVELIKLFVYQSTSKNSLILDSFAGSGTTAQAVLELNKEDGGNRKFILVECEDYANKITATRVRRVIKGVKNAKDKNLKKGLGGSFTYCTLGQAIGINNMLRGDNLPSYEDLARHIFWIATGETLSKNLKKKKNGFIGEAKQHRVYLLYEADVEKLKKLAFTQNQAIEIIKTDKSEKKKLVFAPITHTEEKVLRNLGIIFCQLPWTIHQRMV